MRRWQKALATAGVALAVLVPSGVAVAGTSTPNPGNGPAVTRTCTGDQQMLQLRDGTGWRHTVANGGTVQPGYGPGQPGSGYGQQHMSGPRDGTGYQWGPRS